MGRRLARVGARQHPDLTASASSVSDRTRTVLFAVLALDGVLSALMAVFFLPLWIGTVPFPISALISGAINMALVWAASQWTSVPRLAGLPLWTWLATVCLLTVLRPGDDVVFGGAGIMEFGPVLLVAVGALPAGWLLMRQPPSAGAGPADSRTR